jgi:hypothetical protein
MPGTGPALGPAKGRTRVAGHDGERSKRELSYRAADSWKKS